MPGLCAQRPPRRQRFAALGLLWLALGRPDARAQSPSPAPDAPAPAVSTAPAPEPRPSPGAPALGAGPAAHGPWPIAASVVPGLLVHGSGSFAAGDRPTARRLLLAEGVGLGLVGAGGTLLAVTGASRRIVGYTTAGIIAGGALFVISALADIYGASGPWGGRPVTLAPALETRLGALYVYDPQFRYRLLFDQGLDARLGAWKLGASGTYALGDTNSVVRLRTGYRLAGPSASTPGADGSYLDLDVAFSRHAYTSDHFTLWTGDLMAQGRLDLARVSPSLAGSFAELGLGWALQVYSYNVRGAESDINELLLGRFAFGAYLGKPGGLNGEVSVGYDHRHDGYAAGLKLRGIPSGVAGHFEARGRVFHGAWGLGAEAQVGSAYVVGLSLLHRHGGPW